MEVRQSTNCLLCLHCKDAQVAVVGSQCVFLCVTKPSLSYIGVQKTQPSSSFLNHGCKTIKTQNTLFSRQILIYSYSVW